MIVIGRNPVQELMKISPKSIQKIIKLEGLNDKRIKLIEDEGEDIQTGDVFDLYQKICKKAGLKVLTQRRVSDLVAEMDMLGILNTTVISKGRYGRTREIKVLLGKQILEKIKKILEENYFL